MGSNGGNITDSYSSVTITGGDGSDSLGGLVGTQDGTIENSYATGSVSGVTPENSSLLAINKVNPGQILLETNFVAELPDISPVSVPDGLIAIAINLGDVQRVGNFLRPGSEVVVFNSYGTGVSVDGVTAPGDLTTRVLVPKALVLGIGESATTPTTNPDGTAATQTPSALITLGVDQAEAEKIIQASLTDSLYFGLLGDGTEITRSNGTTAGNLFN